MGYPKSMYKGGYSAEKIWAEEKVAHDEPTEKDLRKQGFVDGKELFSKPPESAPNSLKIVPKDVKKEEKPK